MSIVPGASRLNLNEVSLNDFQTRRVGVYDNLEEAGDYKVLIESQVCEIPAFSEIFGIEDSLPSQEKSYPYRFPAVSITRVHDAFVSRTGSVFTSKGAIADTLEGLINECAEDIINRSSFRELEAICCSSKYGNFNHAVFSSETLPLKYLSALDQQVRGLPSPLYFDRRFCSDNYIDEHQKYLQNLCLPMDEIIIEPVLSKTVFVPCVSRRLGASRASLLSRHLSQISAASIGGGLDNVQIGNRIYVSRRYANSRVPDNINALEKIAESKGFRVVHLEKMQIREQIRAFRSADMIIAEHGAGLINLMFCSPGSRVVELFPAKMYGHWTFRVASFVAGLKYAAGKFTVGDGWIFNKDAVHVNINLFESALNHLLDG